MGIMIDLKNLVWKDNETGSLNKITEFRKCGEIDIIWYIDVESLEEHCMDIDIFVSKHTARGIFDDVQSV